MTTMRGLLTAETLLPVGFDPQAYPQLGKTTSL
jgi:hypothetical protein